MGGFWGGGRREGGAGACPEREENRQGGKKRLFPGGHLPPFGKGGRKKILTEREKRGWGPADGAAPRGGEKIWG